MADDNTTVEMYGNEFDADDLETALDQLPNTTDGIASAGNVFVAADGFSSDDDVHVANVDDVINPVGGSAFDADSRLFSSTGSLRDAIEEARSDDMNAVEHVEEMVLSSNTVEAVDSGHGNVRVEYGDGFFTDSEMRQLDEDEAVTISKVGQSPDDEGGLYMYLDVDEEQL